MTESNDGTVPDSPPGLASSKSRGGRPSNEERRRRLVEELRDIDLVLAEQALSIIKSKTASPSVKVQALNVLTTVKDRDEGDWPPEDKERVDAFLKQVAIRARALEEHFGRPIAEMLAELDEKNTRVH